MGFEFKKIEKELTCDDLIARWASDDNPKSQLSVELEWLEMAKDNNDKYAIDKYAIYDTDDDNYPVVYETINVQDKYLKTLKIKHAPYMLDKFYQSMNFAYLSDLYKELIKSIIQESNKKGINEFRIFIDNDNTIAVLAFQLFAQLLVPDNYESQFSSCKRWLFVNKKKDKAIK